MEIYYKYAKFRSLEELFNATVKLSPPQTLNDPFESMLNQVVEDSLVNNLNLADVNIEVEDENSIDDIIIKNIILRRLYEGLSDYAVFSLSETPRNLLMWAHYADEHKGFCIGYKKDLFESIEQKTETELGIECYTPIKVNYDNLRPQILSNTPSREDIKSLIFNQLITKSDDWMYEKEHRCIIPMIWADKVKIPSTEQMDNVSLSAIINMLRRNKQIVEDEKNKNVYTGTNKGIASLVTLLGNDRNAVFLKRIDPKSVTSIHLGCRFDERVQKELLKIISDPAHPYHHVKVIKFNPSNDRFEVTPDDLN